MRQWVAHVLAVTIGCAVAQAGTTDTFKEEFNAQQKSAIEGIVGSYLAEHPDAVLKALYSARDREEMLKKADAQAYLDSHISSILAASAPYSTTQKNSNVTTVFWVDYQCGYCHKIYKELKSQGIASKVSFMQMPILGPLSMKAASIALSATSENFSAVSDALFTRSDLGKEDSFPAIIKKYKVKMLDDAAIQAKCKENFDWAQNLGIQGVPAVIVSNGKDSQLFLGYVDAAVINDAVTNLAAATATEAPADVPVVAEKSGEQQAALGSSGAAAVPKTTDVAEKAA